jgi:hypothetical protein
VAAEKKRDANRDGKESLRVYLRAWEGGMATCSKFFCQSIGDIFSCFAEN